MVGATREIVRVNRGAHTRARTRNRGLRKIVVSRWAVSVLVSAALATPATGQTRVWRCEEADGQSYHTKIERDTEGKNCTPVTGAHSVPPYAATSVQPQTKTRRQQDDSRVFGSGFVVSVKGEVITNAHVVRSCRSVQISLGGAEKVPGLVEARDEKADLALVRAARPLGQPVALRVGRPLATGEPVLAFGFPLIGLLAQQLAVTPGIVSSTAGIQGDTSHTQVTNPVQPGNSGGPLVDSFGAVVGVIVAKLNALRVAQLTGDVPQNVTFAIKADVLSGFLARSQTAYRVASIGEQLDTVELTKRAKSYTVLIACE